MVGSSHSAMPSSSVLLIRLVPYSVRMSSRAPPCPQTKRLQARLDQSAPWVPLVPLDLRVRKESRDRPALPATPALLALPGQPVRLGPLAQLATPALLARRGQPVRLATQEQLATPALLAQPATPEQLAQPATPALLAQLGQPV